MTIPAKIAATLGLLFLAIPAPSQAEEADVFVVFFEGNSVTFSPEAQGVVANATTRARQLQARRVEIAGFADVPRSEGADDELEIKRATIVFEALVNRGVLRETLFLSSHSNSLPVLSTAVASPVW
ncbi:MAG: OmpA family protein [Acetobacteraceae bacterium]